MIARHRNVITRDRKGKGDGHKGKMQLYRIERGESVGSQPWAAVPHQCFDSRFRRSPSTSLRAPAFGLRLKARKFSVRDYCAAPGSLLLRLLQFCGGLIDGGGVVVQRSGDARDFMFGVGVAVFFNGFTNARHGLGAVAGEVAGSVDQALEPWTARQSLGIQKACARFQ